MEVSEDGTRLIATPLDNCRSEAWQIVHRWVEKNAGNVMLTDAAKNDLAHIVSFAIWEAKGKPMPSLFARVG